MRPFLLTSLLLTAPATSFQTAQAQTNQAQTKQAQTATTLRLTAQPGTSVQLLTSVKTQMTLEDVQATDADGKKMSAAEQAKLRAEMSKGMSGAAQAVTGKTFYKVQGRAGDGTVTLLTSTAVSVPGQAPITIRLTQKVAPGGKTQISSVDSDNPAVKAALSKLSPEMLRGQMGGGGDLTGLYGQSFAVGQARTQTVTLDAQGLLGSLLGGMTAGMKETDVLGKLKATPLTVQTKTTYKGLNASKQHVFSQNSTARPWTIELGDLKSKTAPMHIKMELLDLAQTGQSLYRTDGLPAAQTFTQTMRMRMTMNSPENGRLTMLLRMNQTVTASAR